EAGRQQQRARLSDGPMVPLCARTRRGRRRRRVHQERARCVHAGRGRARADRRDDQDRLFPLSRRGGAVMSSRGPTRRSVLAGCAALPVLAGIFHPVRRAAMAAAMPPPKRLIIFGHTEGTYRKAWLPTGGETNFVLSDVLKPLDPWRSRLLVLDGFSNKAGSEHLAGDTHGKAISAALTGNTVTRRIEPVYIAPSESIDQFLGPKLQGPARLATAEITIGTNYFQNNANGKTNALSYPVGGGNMMFGPDMPTAAFDRLFGGATGGPTI